MKLSEILWKVCKIKEIDELFSLEWSEKLALEF